MKTEKEISEYLKSREWYDELCCFCHFNKDLLSGKLGDKTLSSFDWTYELFNIWSARHFEFLNWFNFKSKNRTICIDFDGTCVTHKYPIVGEDIGAIPVLKKINDSGNRIILHTMRSGKELDDAKYWFYKNGIDFAYANENPEQRSWTSSKKVYANIYIDDSALGCPCKIDSKTGRRYVDWDEVERMLIEMEVIY